MRSLLTRFGEESTLAQDYAHCRAVQKAHGVSYYFATRFFPPETRRAVHALYGFVRYPDQWVDCPDTNTPPEAIRARLDAYERDLIRAVCGEPVSLPPLRAFADVVRRYRIPLRYPLEFLDAMRMDLTRTRYATFEELQTYTWGSASVVGVMMCYILGATGEAALHHASRMGLAMQMTNFLRDVGEDWQRGRIYLPQDELRRFGVAESQIAQGLVDSRWVALMRFQIERCRALYAEAEQGISLLPREAQYPVLLGGRLYARILYAIERNNYDVFRQRARTTHAEKLRLAAATYYEWRYSITTNRSASRM
ncbi:MAG: phytoene/squalene synthase family protein [Fimbriimonadales bacterium]|nr:MAG: phytoene synthase [Fimbriimonadales bacterium]